MMGNVWYVGIPENNLESLPTAIKLYVNRFFGQKEIGGVRYCVAFITSLYDEHLHQKVEGVAPLIPGNYFSYADHLPGLLPAKSIHEWLELRSGDPLSDSFIFDKVLLDFGPTRKSEW